MSQFRVFLCSSFCLLSLVGPKWCTRRFWLHDGEALQAVLLKRSNKLEERLREYYFMICTHIELDWNTFGSEFIFNGIDFGLMPFCFIIHQIWFIYPSSLSHWYLVVLVSLSSILRGNKRISDLIGSIRIGMITFSRWRATLVLVSIFSESFAFDW